MTDEHDEGELSPDEAAAYRLLMDQGPIAPPQLEGQVVGALRTRGLLAGSRRMRAPWPVFLAAGFVLFVAGGLVGRRLPAPTPRPLGSQFILFLDDPHGREPDSEEADRVREYSAWARQQRAAGHLVGGEKLEPEALAIEGDAATAAAAGPAGVVGGYFIVVANDLNGAVAIARTCPHLRHGGRIVIRPIASLQTPFLRAGRG